MRLSTAYGNDEEIRGFCRKLMALTLLLLHELETSFHQLRSTASSRIKEELHQLFLDFDDYWMNRVPLTMWSVHGQEHRTNNVYEGMHIDLLLCRCQNLILSHSISQQIEPTYRMHAFKDLVFDSMHHQ